MYELNGFLQHLITGLIICLFYQKILGSNSNKKLYTWSIPVIFSLYMFFVYGVIQEPFRLIIGFLIFGLLLWGIEKKINFAALIFAFAYGYISYLLAAIITSLIFQIIYWFFGIYLVEIGIIYYYVAIPVLLIIPFALYKLIKIKKLNRYIEDSEIKGIVYSMVGIILSLYSGAEWLSYYLKNIYKPNIDGYFILISTIVLLALIIISLIFLIAHLAKKHRQILGFKSEINMLEKRRDDLLNECEELVKRNHRLKDVVPAIQALTNKIKSEGDSQYVDVLCEMGTELVADFSYEDIEDNVKGLGLPSQWEALALRIEQIAKECAREGIGMILQNRAKEKDWNKLNVSKTKFICLVGNLLGNAKKELIKTETTLKTISLTFRSKNNIFEFEVHDTAHEFPIEVLVKLGERGNSTNGTGNGYAEVFEFLEEYKASLEINEMLNGGINNKTVRVVFDDKAHFIIHSNYRNAELKKALKEARINVK